MNIILEGGVKKNIYYLKRFFIYFSLCASLSIAIQLGFLSGVSSAGLPKWPHEKSDLKPDPNIIFGKLSNGFRYALMPNRNPKGRVSIHLDVQVGSLYESEEERGLAHFLEHMQFDGSTHFKPGELIKYFQRIGMQYGPDANAHTGFTETVYDIFLPSGDAKSISDGLLVMRDFADGALLLKKEINKERKVILAEMRTRDSADYRTLEASLNFKLPEALISKRLPIGTTEVLQAADHELLSSFYKKWYRPDNMILVMVGEFDSQSAIEIIKKTFHDMRSEFSGLSKPDLGRIRHEGIKSFYHYEKESGNTTVSIENLTEIEEKPDSLALQKKMMVRYLADRIVQNRIDAMLNDSDVPFTSAGIGSGLYLSKIQYAEITADTKSDNWSESLMELEKILRKALSYGFTQVELDRVRNDFQTSLDNEVKKASTRSSKELSRLIIKNLNSDRVLQSPQQEKEIFSPILQKITTEDVNSAFRSVWSPNHRLLLVTGNANLNTGSKTPEKKIREAYEQSRKVVVNAPKEVSILDFPYLPPPEQTGQIVSRKSIDDLGIEQIDFANGVRLNLKKTDFKKNQVNINVAFGFGRSTEPADSPGLSELAQEVVNKSGLGRLTLDELSAALSGKESQIVFRVNEESFLISGSTVSDEILLIFQMVYAYLIDPGFRESAYRLSIERFRQRDQAMTKSVDGVMGMFGERYLAGGDGRFGTASYEELKKISLQKIEKWVRQGFESTPLEISIVGDFDSKEAVDVVARYLGSMPKRDDSQGPERSKKLSFPKNANMRYTVESRIPKSLVVVAYPTDDFWDISRTRRLSSLADLFSERLRVYIREKMGAAYSPHAYNLSFRAYPGFGMLRSEVTTKPSEVDTVVKAVKEIAHQIYQEPISADELKRIKDPTTNYIKDLRQTNKYWLNSVLTLSSRHPQQIEWSRTIIKDYQAITAEDLSNLAKRYLRNESAATVVIVPKGLN